MQITVVDLFVRSVLEDHKCTKRLVVTRTPRHSA